MPNAFSASLSLLSDVSTGTGTPVAVNHCKQTEGVVSFGAGVSAGVIVIEGADSPAYTGEWDQIDKFDAAALILAGRTVPFTVQWAGAFPVNAVRARVTANLVGGTGSATLQGRLWA